MSVNANLSLSTTIEGDGGMWSSKTGESQKTNPRWCSFSPAFSRWEFSGEADAGSGAGLWREQGGRCIVTCPQGPGLVPVGAKGPDPFGPRRGLSASPGDQLS